jgi:hypothetical protein
MSTSQKDLFLMLDAPLANARWSWGSVRAADGAVFLRVWQDKTRKFDNALFVRVAWELDDEDEAGSLGYQERVKHVELIKQGAKCFLIMCQADDIEASPRKVKDFDTDNVFRGEKIAEIEGDWWVKIGSRVPVREVALKSKGK